MIVRFSNKYVGFSKIRCTDCYTFWSCLRFGFIEIYIPEFV